MNETIAGCKNHTTDGTQRIDTNESTTGEGSMTIANHTVVLVDDDKSVRIALARLFRSADIQFVAFESAEAFLASGLLDSVGCLIADIRMPQMRGLELQEICAKRRPSLPIIMISAFSDDDAENRARTAGALAFLHKPFDATSLLGLVRKALGL
jgi:two-component system response regulator FixJ